jgi:hypothetical protein
MAKNSTYNKPQWIDAVNWGAVVKGVLIALAGLGVVSGSISAGSDPSQKKFEIHEAIDSVNRIDINKKLDRILQWIEVTDKRLNAIELANARIEGRLE